MGFGGVGWTTPSNRAKYGTIYSYDYNQNVFFPKDIYAQYGTIYGKTISEGGTPLADKYLGKVIATATVLGGVKSKATGTTANRNYNVEVNSDGTMKVNVPWTDTIKTATKSSTTGISVSAALAANPSFTGTAHTHTITDNGHTHTYEKAKVTDANKTDVVKSASFAATYDANNHRRSFGFTATNTKVLTGIGYESAVATSKATTGIAVGSTTAGGTVSKPNINVTVTDPGHTHGI